MCNTWAFLFRVCFGHGMLLLIAANLIFDPKIHFHPADSAMEAAQRFCVESGITDKGTIIQLVKDLEQRGFYTDLDVDRTSTFFQTHQAKENQCQLSALLNGTCGTSSSTSQFVTDECSEKDLCPSSKQEYTKGLSINPTSSIVVNIDGLKGPAAKLEFHLIDDPLKAAENFCKHQFCDKQEQDNIAAALFHVAREHGHMGSAPRYLPHPFLFQALHGRVPNDIWSNFREKRHMINDSIPTYPFFVLNLDRSIQRFWKFKEKFIGTNHNMSKINVSILAESRGMRRYPAVDAEQLHIGALKEAGILSQNFPFNKRGNAAVALSHLSMWVGAMDHNLDYLTILEDDVIVDYRAFHIKMYHALSALQKNAPHWDILFLGHNNFMCNHNAQTAKFTWNTDSDEPLQFSRPNSKCMSGFFGYVVSRKGFAKLTKLVLPLSVALDDALRPLYYNNERPQHLNRSETYVQAFMIHPPVIFHDFKVKSERVAAQSLYENNVAH